MGKIVNWVTELHLKHAYFPRIGSQIDLLKDLLFCKTMNVGLTCHRTQKDRGHVTGGQTGNLQFESMINTQKLLTFSWQSMRTELFLEQALNF